MQVQSMSISQPLHSCVCEYCSCTLYQGNHFTDDASCHYVNSLGLGKGRSTGTHTLLSVFFLEKTWWSTNQQVCESLEEIAMNSEHMTSSEAVPVAAIYKWGHAPATYTLNLQLQLTLGTLTVLCNAQNCRNFLSGQKIISQ